LPSPLNDKTIEHQPLPKYYTGNSLDPWTLPGLYWTELYK